MRLDEYFAHFRASQLDKEEQMQIYNQFLHKSHRVLNLSKVGYYAKVTSFSFATLLVAMVVYIAFSPETNGPWSQLAQIGDGTVSIEQLKGVVQADTVWRILVAQGEIHIFQGDKEVSVTELTPNEKVILSPGAKVTFSVRDGLKATILWPAEFVLESLGTKEGIASYAINLLVGDYLEVVSYNAPTTQPTQAKQPEQVVIKTADFQVENVKTDATVDVVIASNEQGKTMIANNGDDVLIKSLTKDENEHIVATVKSHQTLALAENLEILPPEEAELVFAKLKDTPLAIRYEVEPKASSPNAGEQGASLAASVARATETDGKEVIPVELAGQLRSLSASSLNSKLQQMVRYYLEGNEHSFGIAYANVLNTVQRATVWLVPETSTPPASEQSLMQWATWIEGIASQITTQYYVTPQYQERLQALSAVLRSINQWTFGEFAGTTLEGLPLTEALLSKGITMDLLLVP
jgi:hypothetical protein